MSEKPMTQSVPRMNWFWWSLKVAPHADRFASPVVAPDAVSIGPRTYSPIQ